MRWLAPFADTAYALLRIMAGFMFSLHGFQKMFGVLGREAIPFDNTQMWIGGVIELVGGLGILLGYQTRLLAFLCSGTMAVAYIQFHWKFAFDGNFFPVVNQGEPAVLYCFVFLYIACRGGGKWALDKTA